MLKTTVKTLSALGCAVLVLIYSSPGRAGAPLDQLRQTVDRILTTLNDSQLKEPAKKNQRRENLKELIRQRFDFNEMARRSLGPQWQRLTPQERQEFAELFIQLLETAYLDTIESYGGEKVEYLRERLEGSYAEVESKIIDKRNLEYLIDYRLQDPNANDDWKVYDVLIEKVSLVNNYRSQFRRVLERASFQELLQMMREKAFSTPNTKS